MIRCDEVTEQTAKAMLMELPPRPMYCLLVPDVPNANGRVFPRAVIAKACSMAQDRIRNGALVVSVHLGLKEHEVTPALEHATGIVEHAELDADGALVADIMFFNPIAEVAAKAARFSLLGTGFSKDSVVVNYVWEGVAMVP